MTNFLTVEQLAGRLGMSVLSTLDLCHASGVTVASGRSRVQLDYTEIVERRAVKRKPGVTDGSESAHARCFAPGATRGF